MYDFHPENSAKLYKVSSELKAARNLVRLAAIEGALQDQKLRILRQKMKDLELELGPGFSHS